MKKKNNNGKDLTAGTISMVLILLFCMVSAGWSQSNSDMKKDSYDIDTEKNNVLVSRVSQEKSISIADQVISAHFEDVYLLDALKQIAEDLEMNLSYSKEVLPIDKEVTADFQKTTANKVIYALLEGTGLRYAVSQKGSLILFRYSDRPRIPEATKQTAQMVSGTVTDAGSSESLPGVNIAIKGTTQGTSTDGTGHYELEVSTLQDTLIFSFVGYEAQEVPINGRTELDVQLQPQTIAGEEMVVVGYGTQRKEDVTGSVSSVDSENFLEGSITDAAQLVQGKVAGLNIVTPDANPTSSSQINLRGVTTLLSNTDPLVLIDGVPGALDEVSPKEIESVDVLKSGSAAAIYGTRGTNGVILITTENVSGDIPATIELNSYVSTQRITKELDFMTPSEYRVRIEEGIPGAIDQGANTDWLNEITQNPVSQVHDISIKGGNANTSYIASLRYSDQNGIIKKSNNVRIYPRLEVDHTMFDGMLNINANVSGYQQEFYAGSDGASYDPDVYYNGLIYNPTAPLRTENGEWFENINRNVYANPMALLQETRGENKNSNVKLYGTVTLDPVRNLSIQALGSRNIERGDRGYYETRDHISTIRDGLNGYASRGASRSQEDLLEITAQYNKTFRGDHNVKLLAGYSWNKFNAEDYYMQNWDFPTDGYSYNNLGAGLALSRGEAVEESFQEESKLVSYFSRFNYSYKGKYLLMASLRYEGSSKFGANNKWATFPAVSVGWNIHNESFLEEVGFLTRLKIRGGFGITGSIPDSPYLSLNTVGFDDYNLINGVWIQALSPESNANPNLRWETKEEINIGLDYGFLEDRITGSVDVYQRTTKDMLFNYSVPTPPYLFDTITANAATMENKGLEVQINTIPVQSDAIQWNSSVSYSTNQNEVASLSNENFQLASGFFDEGNTGEPIQQTTHRVQIGQPIGNFYGYKTVDIDENGNWIIEGADGEPKPIADQQADDKQILGNGLPNHYLSWNNNISYKRFNLNVQMRGALDFQILNTPRMFYEAPVMMTRGNVLSSAFDDVYGKRPLSATQALQYVGYYIEDGDYWKISNITLGYNFDLLAGFVQSLRVYASATNVATITGYDGIDPEVNTSGLDPGVDNRFRYPAASTYTIGFSVTF